MLVVLLAAAWFVLWAVRGGLRRIAFTPRHGLWLYIPGIAGIVRAQNLSAIGQLMAALLRAGMPLPEALESVAACRLSGPYRRGLRRVQERVEQDTCLAEALAPEPRLFPKGFQAFVRLGEHSGLLAEAFARTGEQYRRRHATFNHYLRTAVTPAGILLLGAVNLMITLAAFQMLVAMADSVMGDF